MRYVGHGVVGSIISVGAILTLLTVTIAMMYSLARLLYAISKDGLLPKAMQAIDPKHKTPKKATYIAGVFLLSLRQLSVEYLGRIDQHCGIVVYDLNVLRDHQAEEDDGATC